jgi:hypothetical protein
MKTLRLTDPSNHNLKWFEIDATQKGKEYGDIEDFLDNSGYIDSDIEGS